MPLHIFPNPNKFPDRFKTWVNLVGGKLETPSDYEFYRKQRLCDIHFSIDHKNRFKRLNALAVPSLHLSGEFPLSTFADVIVENILSIYFHKIKKKTKAKKHLIFVCLRFLNILVRHNCSKLMPCCMM